MVGLGWGGGWLGGGGGVVIFRIRWVLREGCRSLKNNGHSKLKTSRKPFYRNKVFFSDLSSSRRGADFINF